MLTEDEKLKLQLNHTLNLPGGGESVKTSDAYTAAEFEQAVTSVSSETAAELEARFLAERGISARPGIRGHELPIPVVDAERELDHTLPGADESVKTSDAAAELEQAETAVSSETPAELEARFLAERGISARPSVFPYQDGKVSKRSRELERVLAEDQERKDRYGDDYRIHKKIEGW